MLPHAVNRSRGNLARCMHTVNRVAAPILHDSFNATGNTSAQQLHDAEPQPPPVQGVHALNPTWSTPYVQPVVVGAHMPAFHPQQLVNGLHLAPRSHIPFAAASVAFQNQQDDLTAHGVSTPHGQHIASSSMATSQPFGMPVRGFVGPQYANVGFRYGYIGVQPDPMVHAPAYVATPPVAPSTPFPSAIHPEIQPTVQAPPDPREQVAVGVDTLARTDGPSSNAVADGFGRAVNATARAHSPPIWNVNSLLPGNPDVHIRAPTQLTAADATGVGEQPTTNATNAGRGAGARGNSGRGRGTGTRGNAGRGRGTGARGNAGRGTGERGNAARGRGARGRGGRASAGRGTGVGSNGGSANGQGAPGVTGKGGTGNGPVNRPRIRRRRVDVVPHTARNGSREGSEGPSDEDDADDDDEADDSWNDDDDAYLSNSLSALNEDEAEDNERVRGTRRDDEVPIADWNRLGVDDTPAAKREMCYGILYGVSEATLKKYRGWATEYKRFMAHELPKLDAGRFGEEAALRNANPDEIGAALEQDMGGEWKLAEGDEQWFHGPETNPWRLRKYVTFLANETVAQADRMATLKRPDKTLKKRRQCTPAMLMGRLKALNMLIKLDGAIFRKPVLNLLRDFAECRIWVRVQVRDQYKRFIAEHVDRHRGTAADTYTPDEFKKMMRKTSMDAILISFKLAKKAYTQAMHRDLCIRTMTVLGHHTLARGCTIRNLQLPDMMMWKLGAKSETDPVRNAFMFVCACRTGKTNKDFSLNYISAVRHIDWTLCAVGATLLWLHWVYDLVPILYEDIAPPLDFTEPSTWYDQYLFFPLCAGTEKQIPPTTHHDWAAKILDDAGITCSRVVHATRAGGAQHASVDGMPSDQLARLGGWRFIDVMTKHYLTTIPREAVLLKAGFTGVDGDYFLGRATVPVSEKLEELLKKHIFPWAAEDKGQKQCKEYNRKMVKEQKPEKQDTAGLNILKELDGEARMAVAQDLAMYYIHQPEHPMDAQNQVTVLTEYLTRSQADNTRLGVELAATHKRVQELEGLLEDRDRQLVAKDERVNALEAQLSRLTMSSSEPPAAHTPGAAAGPAKAEPTTDQGTWKKPAQPTREETIRDAIVQPWVDAAKPSDAWKLYKSTHPLVGESPESLLAQPRGAVTRLAELIGKAGGGPNAINRVKRVMDFVAHRVEQGDNLAVVLDKLDLVSVTVGMSGVSEGIAVKKKSVDVSLSELKKGSPAEVQLRVKWMLVRDRFIDASLPASEFLVAWPQYCAQMPPLA
ncbi:unnamed protein product [Closterium sp. Naga37s-1]|nr:unnamed protein product [Closterium sp. Naga37s-1]